MFPKVAQHYRLFFALLIISTMLVACTTPATSIPPTSLPPVPTDTTIPLVPTNTTAPPAPTAIAQPTATPSGQAFSIDFNGVAQSSTTEIVAAVPKTADSPWWQPMPQYLAISLVQYPVSSLNQPQIFIIPTADLPAWNPDADKQVKDMQTLLASHMVASKIPFLPLKSDVQIMQSAIKGLDFKNGQGVRFLTQYNNGIAPINNQQLFYTYQGLTSDGQFYVSAILPVIVQGLPADSQSLPPADDPFFTDNPGYVAGVVKTLSEAPTSKFTPDLSTLDAMMSSFEVK